MLTEIKCGRTHFQLFNGTECVCTVRAEYKDAVKAAIEQQMASVAPTEPPYNRVAPTRNGDDMRIVKLDLLDGMGYVEVAVGSYAEADRLQKFSNHADTAFADQERWIKVRSMMSHERSGPNVGWTLGMLMPGDDPDTAVDEYQVDPLAWSKKHGIEEF